MIQEALAKYPNLQFKVENGEEFRTEEKFDAVFSNTALHWMKRAANVIESVWMALKPGGRFVAEFGGKGNVELVIKGLENALHAFGISAAERNPWFYPSVGEYASLLEKQGFRVTYALHFTVQHRWRMENGAWTIGYMPSQDTSCMVSMIPKDFM